MGKQIHLKATVVANKFGKKNAIRGNSRLPKKTKFCLLWIYILSTKKKTKNKLKQKPTTKVNWLLIFSKKLKTHFIKSWKIKECSSTIWLVEEARQISRLTSQIKHLKVRFNTPQRRHGGDSAGLTEVSWLPLTVNDLAWAEVWLRTFENRFITGKCSRSKPIMCRIVQCLQLAIYPSKGDMNEAFTGLTIQKRQTNLPLDRDDKCYKVAIDKRVLSASRRDTAPGRLTCPKDTLF